MTYKRHELTDAQYEKIKGHLPPQKTGKKGRPRKDHRLILNGILWILATGAPWRDWPERFGSWKTIYWRFRKWQKEGLFETILQRLTKDADMENLLIDSTCIKVHQSSNGGQKKGALKAAGKTKGGLNTKIHALTEALGLPLKIHLSPGNDHDSKHALELLSDLSTSESCVIADKAYGSKQIREYIEAQGWSYEIPPKFNAAEPWLYDQWRYKERFQVECFFQKINCFRRIATRFEKFDESFKAFIFIASILIWLK